MNPVSLLDQWLERALDDAAKAWLHAQCATIAGGDKRAFFLAFSAASRRTGKDDLRLSGIDLAQASEAAPGWNPRQWSRDQAARARLVLALPSGNAEVYTKILDQAFAAADVGELVALYQSLPLLPHAQKFAARAAEGVRSNIKAVFEAVALDNPFPAAHLDECAWNQLVLKALFVGSPLDRVVGLDARANAKLTRMLCDFAHERWAAKRPVAAELWRPVSRAMDDDAVIDLEYALKTGPDRAGIVAAISGSKDPRVQTFLAK